MIAVGGFAKALPPHGAGYDFANAGAMETRFMGITWLESNYRVRWRWNDEALFHDLDGTFADQPFCAGCHVLKNPIVSNAHSFPECYQDEVCGAARASWPKCTHSLCVCGQENRPTSPPL